MGVASSPFISIKPSLASYLNLPIPPHLPPTLLPKFKPSHNSDAVPDAFPNTNIC